ncbi:MAG: N-6 DNA methylase, partial [Chloroflexi bacterium]|nr:N-6 DNA methylase [Chloroflexota bacterium]
MTRLNLKATSKPVKQYFAMMGEKRQMGLQAEGNVAPAFADLLGYCARQAGYTFNEQHPLKLPNNRSIRLDGAVLTRFNLRYGAWEAKDSQDDLRAEIRRKFEAGYPRDNILFQSPDQAILFQDGREVLAAHLDAEKPQALVDILQAFFSYSKPAYDEWEQAVEEFKRHVKDVAEGLDALIEREYTRSLAYKQAFDRFFDLCRSAINPNLSKDAVEEMLIQHILTERIFRRVFQNERFTRQNAIAREIETVVDALTGKHFNRDDFMRELDHFYGAIETTAATITDYNEKQDFLNTVYEQFFQGFSVKVADTHGIVYTPQPIVQFMVRSVEELLRREFNRSLADPGVHILDPFVGTGNFILRVMEEIRRSKPSALPHKYAHELHCNEVMLLPYYIASMNIEHAYYEAVGEYAPFEGICLVDTFDLAEERQMRLFTEANSARVERQRQTDLTVILGNPPYNVGQINENDNNKNRKYAVIDRRVQETYTRAGTATLRNALSDPYVKAFRWASDRIRDEGIVAFVSNNSFIDNIA